MNKERLDILLVKKSLFETREKAKSSIMAGCVYVNNQKVDKPGMGFDENVNIEIRKDVNPYVSRGGLKIEKALQDFNIDLLNKIVIDIGASTGGFTDCMLVKGAKKVFAIDVGYGQLAWKLRNDERVVCMERTNARNVSQKDIGILVDFVSIDVSFISLKKILPVLKELLGEKGEVFCLVKPQFEAGREQVGKNGVIKDKKIHEAVLKDIIVFSEKNEFFLENISYSPIKGPKGNIEFLVHFKKIKTGATDIENAIRDVVNSAHSELD